MQPLLRDLLVEVDPDDLLEFHRCSRTFAAAAGEVLYRPAEVARGLTLVFDGRIAVEREGGERIAEFGRGSYFGERTLVGSDPVGVYLVAVENVDCVEYPSEPARRFLQDRPAFGYAVLKALFTGNLARLSATNRAYLEARALARQLEERNHELQESLTRLASVQEELVHAQHLAAIGTMVAGVAHEINSPLAWVHQSVATALERLESPAPQAPDRILRPLQRALDGTGRIRNIVEDLRGIGKAERMGAASSDVAREVDGALRMLESAARESGVTLVHHPGDRPGEASLAPTKLGQLLVNLIRNALDASPPGSAVEITTDREPGHIRIRVADRGCGMSPEVKARIFDPFFTTRAVGRGSGLGLWVCRSIVSNAGGSIEVESAPGDGSTFTIRLPAAPGGDAPSPRLATAGERNKGRAGGVPPGGDTGTPHRAHHETRGPVAPGKDGLDERER